MTGSELSTALQDDRFLLLESVGRGGMATVFRAFDRLEQRTVALKVQGDNHRPGPSHPLSEEFEAWSRLAHPNIVRAYELRVAHRGPFRSGEPYLVLEHVGGGPVHRCLPARGAEPRAIEGLAIGILRGLCHVHAAGIVHRDLKPANVLVEHTQSGLRARLTDFGLAAPMGTAEEPGTISGSLPYVAPEAIVGFRLDGRADLYALGVLLYRLATGNLPASDPSPEAIIRWHLEGEAADPRLQRPDFDDRFSRFIQRLCARDRAARPASAEEALAELGTRDAASEPRTPDRAERAAVRLALDAARQGAWRQFPVAAHGPSRTALLREVRVWCQVRDIGYYGLEPRNGDRLALERLVLRVLVEHPAAHARRFRRLRLDRFMAISFPGGVPLLDTDVGRDRSGLPAAVKRRIATGLSAFLVGAARERPLVLDLSREGPRDVVAQLLVELLSAIEEKTAPGAARGGLLLLVPGARLDSSDSSS